MTEGAKCESCGRILYTVRSVALLVAGTLSAQRNLCIACRTAAVDAFTKGTGS